MKATIDLDRMNKDMERRLENSPQSSLNFQTNIMNIIKEFVMQYVTVENE
jgi:hypothetical protein